MHIFWTATATPPRGARDGDCGETPALDAIQCHAHITCMNQPKVYQNKLHTPPQIYDGPLPLLSMPT